MPEQHQTTLAHPWKYAFASLVGPLGIASAHATFINPFSNKIGHQLEAEETTKHHVKKFESKRIFDGLAAAKIGASLRITSSIILSQHLTRWFSEQDDLKKYQHLTPCYSALIGGWFSGLLSNPFEGIPQTQQFYSKNQPPISDVVQKIIRENGVSGLCRASFVTSFRSSLFASTYIYGIPRATQEISAYTHNQIIAYMMALTLFSTTISVPITILQTLRFWKQHNLLIKAPPASYYTIITNHALLSTLKPRTMTTTFSFLFLSKMNEMLNEYLDSLSVVDVDNTMRP